MSRRSSAIRSACSPSMRSLRSGLSILQPLRPGRAMGRPAWSARAWSSGIDDAALDDRLAQPLRDRAHAYIAHRELAHGQPGGLERQRGHPAEAPGVAGDLGDGVAAARLDRIARLVSSDMSIRAALTRGFAGR